MGELTILSGGMVEVDPASLRLVAGRLRALAEETADAAAAAADAGALAALPEAGGRWEISLARAALADGADAAAALAASLERAADLYDAVEIVAAGELAAASGSAAAVRLAEARLRELARDDPVSLMRALELVRQHSPRDDLNGQILAAGRILDPGFGAFLVAAAAVAGWAVDIAGRGAIPAGQALGGATAPVQVRPEARTIAVPPATLADAAARMPGGGAARVRVERYVTATGPQFVVYIAGTQSVAGTDPFDMASNLQLYDGDRSASYDATLAALEAAGARPGDVVHAFGHSQGGMIAERLATGGPYQVQTLVSFGSPVQADSGDGTLAVSVRHTDDPVAALQGGGHAAPVGAGGFVVEREADPAAGIGDLLLPAHQMTAYAQTAALVDESADPRVDGLRDVFAGLSTARSGVAAEYAAERISRSASDGR